MKSQLPITSWRIRASTALVCAAFLFGLHSKLSSFIFSVFNSEKGQLAIGRKEELVKKIREMEENWLQKWSCEIPNNIHLGTNQNLVQRGNDGYYYVNFDKKVIILFYTKISTLHTFNLFN